MEIGLVCDVVDQAILIHWALVSKDNLAGKSYKFCLETACEKFSEADTAFRTTEKIYDEIFPEFLVHRTKEAEMLFWNTWVKVDETVSTKVSDQLSLHPFFRMSTFEITQDVKKSMEETKIWKIGQTVVTNIGQIFEILRS